jgi:hypothetical protein
MLFIVTDRVHVDPIPVFDVVLPLHDGRNGAIAGVMGLVFLVVHGNVSIWIRRLDKAEGDKLNVRVRAF